MSSITYLKRERKASWWVGFRVLLIFLLPLLLTACENPLPEDKLHYSGVWQGENTYLQIQPNGRISYKQVSKGVTKTINAPIQEFNGNDFIVGLFFFNTTFVVSEPPTQVQNEWHMTVDGIKLTKVAR